MTQQERLTALFKEFGIEPMEGYSTKDFILRDDYGDIKKNPFAHIKFLFDNFSKFKYVGVWK